MAGIAVRKFLIVTLTSLAAFGAQAWPPTTAQTSPEAVLAQSSYPDGLVTVTPGPMSAAVIQLARYSPTSPGIRPAKKAKVAKVAGAKSILSRSAREQIVLARSLTIPEELARLSASDDEDDNTGLDDLDLHRSFSQPKVAKPIYQAGDDDEDLIDLPDHVKLRLLMARTKAVEAHVLSQAGKTAGPTEEELSDTVKVRLYMARARALKAHCEKYGAA